MTCAKRHFSACNNTVREGHNRLETNCNEQEKKEHPGAKCMDGVVAGHNIQKSRKRENSGKETCTRGGGEGRGRSGTVTCQMRAVVLATTDLRAGET